MQAQVETKRNSSHSFCWFGKLSSEGDAEEYQFLLSSTHFCSNLHSSLWQVSLCKCLPWKLNPHPIVKRNVSVQITEELIKKEKAQGFLESTCTVNKNQAVTLRSSLHLSPNIFIYSYATNPRHSWLCWGCFQVVQLHIGSTISLQVSTYFSL